MYVIMMMRSAVKEEKKGEKERKEKKTAVGLLKLQLGFNIYLSVIVVR